MSKGLVADFFEFTEIFPVPGCIRRKEGKKVPGKERRCQVNIFIRNKGKVPGEETSLNPPPVFMKL
jgi:hypothetical protein